MQVVPILIGHDEERPEGLGVLDLHLVGGVKQSEAGEGGHKGVPNHAHAQQAGDADGRYKALQ